MAIKATITVDDDRWVKNDLSVSFDDPDCNKQFGRSELRDWSQCYKQINAAKNSGYEIDSDVDEKHI